MTRSFTLQKHSKEHHVLTPAETKRFFLGQLCHLDRRRHRIRRFAGRLWQIGVTSSASHKPNSGQSPVEAWSGLDWRSFSSVSSPTAFGYGKLMMVAFLLHGFIRRRDVRGNPNLQRLWEGGSIQVLERGYVAFFSFVTALARRSSIL